MNIVVALLVLAVLIIVHEIGHYFAARKIGIPVYEFSVGFGKLLWSRKNKDGVQFSLRLIPLGGYVKMAGEEPGDTEAPNGYSSRRPWEKMLVSFAGPFMNLVAGAVIFIMVFAVIGVAMPSGEPVIGSVLAGKPAVEAGLEAGDRVISINNQDIASWEALVKAISSQAPGSIISMEVERAGQTKSFQVGTVKADGGEHSVIGIMTQVIYVRESLPNAVKLGFIQTYDMTMLLFDSFGMIFSGSVPASEISGPVGITSMIGDVYQSGAASLLIFMGFLSINLGVMNLLPIPALDGSRIVFAVIEAVRRKPIDAEKEGLVHMIGFFLLIGLMIFATYNDIVRLIRG